ncbi:PaaI family thioesterase [Halorientalis halophila]|uniref:PaaI family thioesterase n=1 Tax=Halorientalis halophila TaxID=3108499 RepID=UPI00300824FD
MGDDGEDSNDPLDIDPDAPSAEVAEVVLSEHGYLSWLNLSVAELSEGRTVMELPYQEKLANWVTGTIHGGVTATVIDTASAFALRTTMDDPMETTLATTDLDVKYVRPATSDIRVEAEVIRSGTSTGVTRVTVTGETDAGERKIVAIGATTYRLFTDSEL